MKIRNVKGGYNYLPKEQKIRNYINKVLEEEFVKYGFKSIETPILCYYDILSDKYDCENDILKEIYKLSDQGKRKLGLRYDLTVPFAKFIALNKNKIKFPFKRYEIAKVFRDGPIKIGRDREFTQCDVDVVGLCGQLVEAELLSLCVDVFERLNIDIVIKYNSRRLMKGLILECGIDKSLIQSVTTIIDKKDKLSEKEFIDNLINVGVDDLGVKKLIKYFDFSLEEINKIFENTLCEDIKIGLEELNNLNKYLKGMGIDSKCMFSSSLVRGQNYYTGNVFEVYDKDGVIKGSICGGGRYDKMITEFIDDGKNYPTVGISFGLSVIYEFLKNKEKLYEQSDIDIYIIPINTEIECLNIARKLRGFGYKVEVEKNLKKLKKSLDFANKENIAYVIIVGEDEINRNSIIVKDMFNYNDFEISLDDLEKIRKIEG